MTRIRTTLSLTGLALTAVLTVAACGAGPEAARTPAPAAADLADEAYVLTAMGLPTGLEPGPAPSASASAPGRGRRPGVRGFLRENTLHGEMTMRGKDGVRTILVQRGTVTAVDAAGVSVKSADGFSRTWTFGTAPRIVRNRQAVAASAIKTGAEVGLAGREDGGRSVARLIVLR